MISISAPQSKIRQYDTDPAPKIENAWVLRSVGAGGTTVGMPMGLLLALTYAETSAGAATTYRFSYRTKESTTLRVAIS